MPRGAKKFGRRYPWSKWFTLKKFTLVRGKDYDCQSYVMAQMARNVARLKTYNVNLDIKLPDDGESLTIKVLGKRSTPGES